MAPFIPAGDDQPPGLPARLLPGPQQIRQALLRMQPAQVEESPAVREATKPSLLRHIDAIGNDTDGFFRP